MTADELPTFIAIHRVERLIEERRQAGEFLPLFGSDDWLIDRSRRVELLSMIQSFLVPDEALLSSYLRYRKSGDKLRIIAALAVRHGARCFFDGRGKGECSNELDLDRIIPGARGGEYSLENCHIVCSRHNRERGDRAIEEYLRA